VGRGSPGGCVWADLNSAAGSNAIGIWIPLGDYGLFGLQADQSP
jgi:hypothetical protein